ncbi:hypothetical protein TPE_1256 [Treponema pedis str. T A4]|uniref:Uncharacterized protein n=1 Tax=Treponema pedis str. T A4 TaxID=1291379 RepID=S6A3P3_9SPIR|nr:hypothetical protein TPE_1256 [Treponema pedis str. T A4]
MVKAAVFAAIRYCGSCVENPITVSFQRIYKTNKTSFF